MKNIKRTIAAMLAMVMLLSVLLTGCGVPKITYNKLPDTAATYGDNQKLTSGQYLAYLYLEFENMYFNQGLYQYASYGMDPWAQTFPYGEGENAEKLILSDYIIRAAQENIKRQIVLAQILKDNGLEWDADDLKEINDSLKGMEADAYLPLGFNNDSYAYALKNANLNERSAFYGIYGEMNGKKGPKAIADTELKDYFDKNYVSYKMISIALTDKNGKELDKEGEAYKKIMDRMAKYEKLYAEKGFDAMKEEFDKDEKAAQEEASKPTTTTTTGTGTNTTAATTTAAPTTSATTTATTTAATTTGTTADEHEGHDHDHEEEEDKDPNRVDADSTTMDEEMAKAIKGVEVGVGKGKKVEFKNGGSTPTVALIERLSIDTDRNGKEGGLYEDSIENIIYEMKYEEFDKEVDAKVAALTIVFDEKVVKKCKPEDFLEIMNNL